MACLSAPLLFCVKRSKPQLIVPSTSTPHEQKPLSHIDEQRNIRLLVPVLMFYRNSLERRGEDPAMAIKEGLAKALVFYYPLAGRIFEGENGKLIVNCNGKGVLFVEAKANVKLKQLGDKSIQPPCPYLKQLLTTMPASKGIIDCPLLLIQKQWLHLCQARESQFPQGRVKAGHLRWRFQHSIRYDVKIALVRCRLKLIVLAFNHSHSLVVLGKRLGSCRPTYAIHLALICRSFGSLKSKCFASTIQGPDERISYMLTRVTDPGLLAEDAPFAMQVLMGRVYIMEKSLRMRTTSKARNNKPDVIANSNCGEGDSFQPTSPVGNCQKQFVENMILEFLCWIGKRVLKIDTTASLEKGEVISSEKTVDGVAVEPWFEGVQLVGTHDGK
nr:methanol O-anthraniloyltransferase-like [Ipomoea batatas]